MCSAALSPAICSAALSPATCSAALPPAVLFSGAATRDVFSGAAPGDLFSGAVPGDLFSGAATRDHGSIFSSVHLFVEFCFSYLAETLTRHLVLQTGKLMNSTSLRHTTEHESKTLCMTLLNSANSV